MKNIDYLVLGLGAMGSAALYHLARMGKNVIGLEQFETGHAWGSSGGHSRALRTFYHDSLYTELAEAALPLWQQLQEASGESLMKLCGFLAYATPGNHTFEKNLSAIKHSGVSFELLTSRDVAIRFPALRIPERNVACFTPRAGFLDPTRCVRAHLSQARQLGAVVLEQVRVESIELGHDASTLKTSQGSYRADHIVITPGPWSGEVLCELDLPLRVSRQQKFYFQPTRHEFLGPDNMPVYADYDTKFYGFPVHDRGIKVADNTHGETTHPDRIDRTNDLSKADLMRKWLANLMPQHSFSFIDAATCMYTLTPDEDFLIGPHPYHPTVVVAAGFSGHGFKFASLTGLILAQLAANGSTIYPIDRFRLDRFS